MRGRPRSWPSCPHLHTTDTFNCRNSVTIMCNTKAWLSYIAVHIGEGEETAVRMKDAFGHVHVKKMLLVS